MSKSEIHTVHCVYSELKSQTEACKIPVLPKARLYVKRHNYVIGKFANP